MIIHNIFLSNQVILHSSYKEVEQKICGLQQVMKATMKQKQRKNFVRRQNVVIDNLEKKVIHISKGTHSILPPYINSIFKKMSLDNMQNTKIFYEFLIAEYDNQNVRFNTTLTHIKILYLFSEHLI